MTPEKPTTIHFVRTRLGLGRRKQICGGAWATFEAVIEPGRRVGPGKHSDVFQHWAIRLALPHDAPDRARLCEARIISFEGWSYTHSEDGSDLEKPWLYTAIPYLEIVAVVDGDRGRELVCESRSGAPWPIPKMVGAGEWFSVETWAFIQTKNTPPENRRRKVAA